MILTTLPSAEDIRRLLSQAGRHGLSRKAVQRLRWFMYAIEHGGDIQRTCTYFGIARSTFLRWVKRFHPHDLSSLEEESRRPHRVRQPETDVQVVELIRDLRTARPLMSKQEIAEHLQRHSGIRLSPSTVGRVIARHCFFFAETPAHRQKRINIGSDAPHLFLTFPTLNFSS